MHRKPSNTHKSPQEGFIWMKENLPASVDTRGHKSEFHFERMQQFWAWLIKWDWGIKKIKESACLRVWAFVVFMPFIWVSFTWFTSEFASGEVSWFTLCLYLSAIDYQPVRWFRWPVSPLGSVWARVLIFLKPGVIPPFHYYHYPHNSPPVCKTTHFLLQQHLHEPDVVLLKHFCVSVAW